MNRARNNEHKGKRISRNREKMQGEEDQSRFFLEQCPVPVILTGPEGTIEYVNPSFSRIFGYSFEEAVGKTPRLIRSGKHDGGFYRDMWKKLSRGDSWRGEIVNRSKNGDEVWCRVSIVPMTVPGSGIEKLLAFEEDFTEQKWQDEKIRHLSLHDSLTGLPNRILLMDRLYQAIARSERCGKKVAVMFIDLNKFKAVNDNLGHEVGNSVLYEISERLKNSVRKVDTLSRVGGDEFVMVLEEIIDRKSIDRIAFRILKKIERPVRHHEQELTVGASIGVAVYPDSGKEVEKLIEKADLAMYRAKKNPESNICYFE